MSACVCVLFVVEYVCVYACLTSVRVRVYVLRGKILKYVKALAF